MSFVSRSVGIGGGLCALLVGAGSTGAIQLTFDFTGIANFVNAGGPFAGVVSVGDGFSGSFIFESTAPDQNPNGSHGLYEYSSLAPAGMTMSVDIGAQHYSTDPGNPNSFILTTALPDFGHISAATNLPDIGANVGVWCQLGVSWPGGYVTSDDLPEVPPDFQYSIDDPDFRYFTLQSQNGGPLFGGELTSMALDGASVVPEPSALRILALVFTGFGGIRLARIKRSRGGALESVQNRAPSRQESAFPVRDCGQVLEHPADDGGIGEEVLTEARARSRKKSKAA